MADAIKLPKDTTPGAAKRVAEAQGQSMLAAKVAVLARAACDDPLVLEIVRVADTLPRLNRDRAVETLHLMAMLDRTCSLLVEALAGASSATDITEARRAVLKEYESAIERLVPAREITEDAAVAALLKNPRYGDNYYKEGMGAVRQVWPLCANANERRLFVEICLISDKGYSKSARGIASWLPPSRADTSTLLKTWLERESNTSVFTSEPLEGEPTSIADQITARYRPNANPPGEDELIAMWASMLKHLSDAKNLDLRRDSLRAVISQDATLVINALRSILPNTRKEVYELNASRFDQVYAVLKPPEEVGDPEIINSARRKKANELGRWAKHLEHSLPALKKLRFGTGFNAPATLAQQLDAIQLDPSVKAPGVLPALESRMLKAEVNKRARERLGGPHVELDTIDPKKLDGALFVTEVQQQFAKEQAELENGIRKSTLAAKSKLPAWPPANR